MVTKHHITGADDIFSGSAYNESLHGLFGRKGAPIHGGIMHSFGAVAALDDDVYFASASMTAGAQTLITSTVGSVMSRGSAYNTAGLARNIIITSAGNDSTHTFTLTGTDIWGQTISETVTGPNTTVVSSVKTYATLTALSISGNSTGAIKVGRGNIVGLPFRADYNWQVIPFVNGLPAVPYYLDAGFTAIGTAETRYLTTLGSGVITAVNGTSDGANGSTNSVVTVKNGKGGSTVGTVTFGTSYVAGTVVSMSSVSNANVSSDQIIEVATDGGGDGASKASILLRVDPAVFTAAVTTDPATATTGDTRGRLNFGAGPDASALFSALILPDRTTEAGLQGIAQYAG